MLRVVRSLQGYFRLLLEWLGWFLWYSRLFLWCSGWLLGCSSSAGYSVCAKSLHFKHTHSSYSMYTHPEAFKEQRGHRISKWKLIQRQTSNLEHHCLPPRGNRQLSHNYTRSSGSLHTLIFRLVLWDGWSGRGDCGSVHSDELGKKVMIIVLCKTNPLVSRGSVTVNLKMECSGRRLTP